MNLILQAIKSLFRSVTSQIQQTATALNKRIEAVENSIPQNLSGIIIVTVDSDNNASMGYNEILECVQNGAIVLLLASNGVLHFYTGYNSEYEAVQFSASDGYYKKLYYATINSAKTVSYSSRTVTTT